MKEGNEMKYSCCTEHGIKQLTGNELMVLGYKTAWILLRTHYNGYRDNHDDLAQEALMEMWQAFSRYDVAKGTVEAYFYGIAGRCFAKRIKRIKHEKEMLIALTDPLLAVLEAPVCEYYEDDIIKRFCGVLSNQERRALRMKLNGKTNTEIYHALYPDDCKKRIGMAMTRYWATIGRKYDEWREESASTCR